MITIKGSLKNNSHNVGSVIFVTGAAVISFCLLSINAWAPIPDA